MKKSGYKPVFTFIFRDCGGAMAWYLFMMLLTALAGPALLLLQGRIVDAAVSGGGSLLWEMGLFGAVSCLSFLVSYAGSMGRQRLKRKLYGTFSARTLDKFSRIRYCAYESEQTFNTIKRMGDAPQEHILEFLNVFLEVSSETVSAVCYGAVLPVCPPGAWRWGRWPLA